MDIMIIGAGGYGRVIADVVEKQGIHTIAGFVDDNKPYGYQDFGYSVIGSLADVERLAKEIPGGVVAVGDNWTRSEIVQNIRARSGKFAFVRAIHPLACIARGAQIGEGAAILAGSMISANACVGNHVTVFIAGLLGHDSTLGDYSSLGPRAVIAGNVKVGAYTAIGVGATLIHQISIGANSVIGAGSTVVKDIPDGVVAYGSPARVQKTRGYGDKYL